MLNRLLLINQDSWLQIKRPSLKNLKSEQRGCILSLHSQHTNRQPFEAVHRSFQFIQNNWSTHRTSNCHLSRKKRNTLHYNFKFRLYLHFSRVLTKLEAEITLSPVTREDKQQGWKKNGEKWKPGKAKIILLRMVRILKMENELWEQQSLLIKTISGMGLKKDAPQHLTMPHTAPVVWHFCPFGLFPIFNQVCLKWILHLVPSIRIFVTVLICRS